MNKGRQSIQLLLIAGLLFTAVTACEKTDDGQSAGNIEDASGNVYKTIKIGNQVWMAENLKTTKYNDGSDIINVTDVRQWISLSTAAYCNYDNLESNVATYGRIYNWYAVNTGKLAPTGWHVPTDNDWTILEDYLIANGFNFDGTKVGNMFVKSLCAKTGWASSNEVGTPGTTPEDNNSTGFTALPGGYRLFTASFCDIEEGSGWWSSTEDDESGAYYRYIHHNHSYFNRGGNYKVTGYSIRLIRDN